MTQILAYIFYFIAASASPLQRRWLATKKNINNSGQIHFAFQVSFVMVILSLLLPLFQPFKISGDIPTLVLLSLVCGLFGSGSYIASYMAEKHVEAGLSSLIRNIYTPFTIVLATIFLNERLTLIQIVGTFFLLIGIVIVSKKHKIGRFKFDKYFLMMLSSGVMLSVLLVAERALMKMTGFTAGAMLSWWSIFLFLGIITLITKNKSNYSRKDIAITGTLRYIQNVSWLALIFVVGNISIVSSITTFKIVIMFIGGALILNEKDDLKRKIVGSVVALIGLLLMK